MKTFPTLYKKTSTGAIQYWSISSSYQVGQMNDKEYAPQWGLITTRFGQVNGKEQVTNDTITEGKNTGKKNATTAYQQAEAEALAKWEKQKKKGYVESAEGAQNDELDELIEGGIVPMLAQSFSKHAAKIKYPCRTQPKLDGIRCIAIVKGGVCTLWSRTRKPITSCPHIVQELEAAFETRDIVLDGELYNHEMKADFEKIVSLVRQEEPGEGHEMVQYHVYDTVNADTFENRTETLDIIFAAYEFASIVQVETDYVDSEEEVMLFFEKFRKQGYEGAMLRNEDSRYVSKRSYDLQKVKEFEDAEFTIIGIEEGRGKLQGHVGSFVCKTSSGKEFLAKMSGDTSKLQEYFENHTLWKDKKLTVQYQGLTGKEGVPRFPVGVAIRDYE